MAFCCKQLLKTRLFTAWVHLHTLLALRQVRVSCTGQWCLSSTTLLSVKLEHLSSCLCSCSESPCHSSRHSLPGLPHTGLPERLENLALGSKGATAQVSIPHTACCLQIQRPVGALKCFAFEGNPFYLAYHFYILFGKLTPFIERVLRSYCMMGLGKTGFCFEAGSTYHNHFFLRFLLFYRKENAHCKESDFSDSDYRH